MSALVINGVHVGSCDEGRKPAKRTERHSGDIQRFRPLDAAALFQKDPDEYAPRMRRSIKKHALDEDGPSMGQLREMHRAIGEAHDSLGELFKDDEFPFQEARGHAQDIAQSAAAIHTALGGGGKDAELTERERNLAEARARDGVELPARSPKVDHRKDFNSVLQGGADEALFDPDNLFQRR